jgi:hypothetical protein
MSYIWVYDNPISFATSCPDVDNSSMSYITYTTSTSPIETCENYTNIQNFGSFTNANNYINDQIAIFKSTFSASSSSINGKTMYERFQDIIFMQICLTDIMSQLLDTYYSGNISDDEHTGQYKKVHDLINNYNNENQIINNGLDELNGTKQSASYSHNVMLNSTVYSTVLWTILAICILYYVFFKL